ncbi:hypothetical protein [Helicobacter suis]|uniref:putative barnase/colicin E5 family endoribonuclease n=1 Tax=Helicobacter suis TaxID=104628 RepID=UPI003D345406
MEGRALQSQTQGAGQELEGRGLQDQAAVKIPHNPAFGTNFEEFYHNPKGAIAKLIETKEGQVAGAFYRKDLGDIDLVWGEIRDQSGKLKGHGLAKIVEKHLDDFKGFEGNSAYEKLGNGLEEIVENGKVVTENGINTLWLQKKGEYYLAGLSKGWKGKGDNHWIITSYKKTYGEIPEEVKGDSVNLSAYNAKFDPVLTSTDEPLTYTPHSTTSPLKSQDFNNYIDVEVIDHPKALPYKSDGQIYKEAKAKGLSYAEFKALREQEQATHTTRYIEFKKAESQNIKDLLDTSKPLKMLKPDQITERLLDQVKKHNAKVWVGELNNSSIIEHLGLKPNQPIKMLVNGDVLKHIEKRHGIHSILAKNGQPPITTRDIVNYPQIVNKADQYKVIETTKDRRLIAGKQINGHVIVVDTISTKNNQLMLKTMYKERGVLASNPEFKPPVGDHSVANSRPSARPGEDLDAVMSGEKTLPQTALKNQAKKPTPQIMAIKSPVFENKPNQIKKAQKADPEGFKYYTTHEDINKFWEFWKNLGLRKSDKMFMPNIATDAKNALRHAGITDIYFDQAGLAKSFKAYNNLRKLLEAVVNPDIILRSEQRDNWIKFLKTNPDDTTTAIHITLTDRDNMRYKVDTRHADSISYGLHNLNTTLSQTEAKKILDDAFSKNNVIYYKSESQEIPHNKAFGQNFKEFYHDPKSAIAKLIETKEGQVAGAFYREDLGDIDLVWG